MLALILKDMKKLIIILILIAGSNLAYCNGGSIAKGGFLNECNTITLLNEKNFSLESEDLTLHVEEDYVFVTAIYLIKNRATKKKIQYGFAVDYRNRPNSDIYDWENDYITNFKILNNGVELKYHHKDEKNIKIDSIHYNLYDTGEETDTISRRWFISELDFDEQECKQLIVSYRVKTNFADWPFLSAYSANYRSTPDSDRRFSYYLKPSGFWGNGKVGVFRLTITFDNIDKYENLIIKGIKGLKKSENSYVLETTNFDLLDNTHLKLSYNYKKWEESKNSWKFINSTLIDSYKYSNQHPKYPASNLFDKDKSTTWVPTNTDENNWIEITFKKHVVLFGVGILNGYTKDNQVYENNNIVTKAKVIVYTNVGERTDSIVKTINLQRKSLNNDYTFYFTGIEDILIGELYGDVEGDNISDYMSSAKSLRIEFLETDKGIKFDDTCISELMLYGAIDENR